jgi:signal transduction histidine kinase
MTETGGPRAGEEGTEPSRSALEFLGRLAGGLVHEIKNPLSTLKINLALLKEDLQAALPGDRQLHRRAALLEDEVDRLEAVLEDFVRYAGIRRLERERVDLGDLTGEVLEFLRPGFVRDGITIESRVGAVAVEVDRRLFKQALLNVLLNAQQAVERGGHICVAGGLENGRAVLCIEDDGCGIEPELQERVFDVYFSASRRGTGLGLPTARRILEEHGGGVHLESGPDAGTRVCLELPCAEPA